MEGKKMLIKQKLSFTTQDWKEEYAKEQDRILKETGCYIEPTIFNQITWDNLIFAKLQKTCEIIDRLSQIIEDQQIQIEELQDKL